MLAVHLVTVRLCAVAGRLPRLLLVALPGLIDTLAQLLAWRSLLWLSMMWRQRYLTQSNFLSTTSLAWSLALHLLFCFNQEKPLQWKEINTHTHTHTHTLTHAHMCVQAHTARNSCISMSSLQGGSTVRASLYPLRNRAKFTGKRLCQGLFFNGFAGLGAVTLLKRNYGTCVFLWILQNYFEHLL